MKSSSALQRPSLDDGLTTQRSTTADAGTSTTGLSPAPRSRTSFRLSSFAHYMTFLTSRLAMSLFTRLYRFPLHVVFLVLLAHQYVDTTYHGAGGDLGSLSLHLGTFLACFSLLVVLSGSRWFAALGQLAILASCATLYLHFIYISNGATLTTESAAAISQSNFLESLSFIWTQVGPLNAALAIVLVGIYFATLPLMNTRPTGRIGLVVTVALISCISWSAAYIYRHRHLVLSQYEILANGAAAYQEDLKEFTALLEQRKEVGFSPSRIPPKESSVVVVMIGESLSRHHLGLYGYPRPTSPRLSARPNIHVFQDVISPHSHTVPSLTQILTLADHSRGVRFTDKLAVDVVNMAKAAGARTYWLSNQNEFGFNDSPVTVLAKQADVVKFHSPGVVATYARTKLDEYLLPSIREALSEPYDGRKVIFIHLSGSHDPYCFAFPKRFLTFKNSVTKRFRGRKKVKSWKVNCYDNSVLYNDWFVDSVITELDASGAASLMLYFSDHGEAPLLNTGHDAALHSARHVEIPFIAWMSAAYSQSHHEFSEAITLNVSKPYAAVDFPHLLAQVLGLESNLFSNELSPFCRCFSPHHRITMNGVINYDLGTGPADYLERARGFFTQLSNYSHRPNRSIFAHRVNSLGKLQESASLFPGIELDVVYHASDNRFRVYHYPDEPDVGLTLVDVLRNATDRPDLKLWLDWKRTDNLTLDAALARLQQLDEQYGLRERTLIETSPGTDSPELRSISRAGFYHSYYLPPEVLTSCNKGCSGDKKLALAQALMTSIAKTGSNAVSFSAEHLTTVNTLIGNELDRRNLRILMWDQTLSSRPQDAKAAAAHFSAENLDALIIRFPSAFSTD